MVKKIGLSVTDDNKVFFPLETVKNIDFDFILILLGKQCRKVYCW